MLDIQKISFEFKPEALLADFKNFITANTPDPDKTKQQKVYIINFYEKLGTFFIDISGEIKKEKISSLKMMFVNYLSTKLNKLKGVVYLFNNTDENSLTFQTVWGLMRIWKDVGIPYEKISYLTASEVIKRRMDKYTKDLGVKYQTSLLEIVKILYPEIAKKPEMEIFEFAAALLECGEGKVCV